MASDATIQPKIQRIAGGDQLDVASGGVISADGTQASHIAAASVAYTTGDLDAESEVIAALNTTNGKINSILVALEGVGILKTS
jgi:hypothetical protein